jgi:hypothetical protein
MEAVCILFHQPIDWKSAKQLLLSVDLDGKVGSSHEILTPISPPPFLVPCLANWRDALIDWLTLVPQEQRKNLFKNRVLNYDMDNVDEAMYSKLQYFKKNPSFNSAAVAQVSKAAKTLCLWVLAVERYATMRRSNQEIQKAMDQAMIQVRRAP